MTESILDEFDPELPLPQRDKPISTAQAKRNGEFSRMVKTGAILCGWKRTLRGAKAGQTRRKNREFLQRKVQQ